MTSAIDPITLSISRKTLTDIVQLSSELTDRMHELLERNTNGDLAPLEQQELEGLVRIAEFGQIVSMAMHEAGAS